MKPIVYFKEVRGGVKIGTFACVFPINHPRCSNENWVLTSTVIKGNEKAFETRNTMYIFMQK